MPVSLLFTGHMIDKPDRSRPRFPSGLEAAAAVRMVEAVTPYALGGTSITRHHGICQLRPGWRYIVSRM